MGEESIVVVIIISMKRCAALRMTEREGDEIQTPQVYLSTSGKRLTALAPFFLGRWDGCSGSDVLGDSNDYVKTERES
jgi:hypothetical protein